MFRKKPTIKPLAPLRSSDRRKLADQIIREYGLEAQHPSLNDAASPEDKAAATAQHTTLRNALLPDNTQSARFTTTQGPDLKQVSGTVYVGPHDGEPRVLWFEVRGKLYPTVYALWKTSGLLPLLHTPDIVVQKLQGGADLMTPGLAGGPPFPERAKKGAVVTIASLSHPSVPVAVGFCDIDVSALGSVQGAKGKAVETMHSVGDELWAYGTSNSGGKSPPQELESWVTVLQEMGLVEKIEKLDIDDVGPEATGDPNPENQAAAAGDKSGRSDLFESADAPKLTVKEIDAAFRNAFLFGVHHHMQTNPSTKNFGLVFPLSQSFVMSTLIQPFLPAYTPEDSQQLQIKNSSFKNIKKLIKSLHKEQIVLSKEQDGHVTVISDIDFEDAAIKNFQPYRLPKKTAAGGAAQGRGETATEPADVGDNAVGQTLKVATFYKPTSKLQPIFDKAAPELTESGGKAKHIFAKHEIRPVVDSYLEAESLVSETNKRIVKLDPVLANGVFDGSAAIDKGVLSKGTVPRDTLVDRVTNGMASSYAILRNPKPEDPPPTKTKAGSPPKIKITVETRSGHKTVTKVSGLEVYFVNPQPLADELRKVCAGSTSVEPLAGATKKHEKPIEEVMIQGPQVDAIVKALAKRGVDRRWIETLDKTKGKGKR